MYFLCILYLELHFLQSLPFFGLKFYCTWEDYLVDYDVPDVYFVQGELLDESLGLVD